MKKLVYLLSLIFALFIGFSAFQSPKEYSIEQFLDTKRYAGACFSFDEKEILYSSDETGIFNIYKSSLDGKNVTQLTDSKEHAYMLISSFPEDSRILFSSDMLGNERNHIFVRNSDGTICDLTPDPLARNEFAGWSKDKKSFYYLTNKRNPRCMDLYEMEVDTYSSSCLFQNDDAFIVADISPDREHIALGKVIDANTSDIYLYNRKTTECKLILAHQDETKQSVAGFSKDSSALFYATDLDHDFLYLKKYDLATGQEETITQQNWGIEQFSQSESERYRVTILNVDAKSVLSVFDTRENKEIELPKLPQGIIGAVSFSKNEKMMLFLVNNDRLASTLMLYNFETNSCYPLANSLCREINPEDLVEPEIVRYNAYDNTPIPALLYKPHNQKKDEKIPALIWVHGGPGGQSRLGYSATIQYLVNHGYAVIAVNNRGSSGYGKAFYKAADLQHGALDLDDCMAAKNYLVSAVGADANKVAIIGGSYGGYMTLAALAFRPDEMAAGVDICGVSNWPRTLKSLPDWWESGRDALYKKIGDPEKDSAYLESISPLFHAQNIKKPLLVLQGTNDPRVLKIESDQIIEAVQKNNVPTRYVVFEDEGHSFMKKQNRLIAAKETLAFLDTYVKK